MLGVYVTFDSKHLMEHAEILLRYANRKVNNLQYAEDLVQECLITAWQKREDFRKDSELQTWLFGILKYKILDFYRSKYRMPEVSLDFESSPDFKSNGSWSYDPRVGIDAVVESNAEEQSDLKKFLKFCISQLSEKNETLFRLKEMDEFTLAEISEKFDMTTNTLAVTLSRVRLKLRSCLQKKLLTKI